MLEKVELMQNCFFENDAQEWHTLDTAEWPAAFDRSLKVEAIRFVLLQPCPTWRQFGLAEIKCYHITKTDGGRDPLGSSQGGAQAVPDHVQAISGYCSSIQDSLKTLRAARFAKRPQ